MASVSALAITVAPAGAADLPPRLASGASDAAPASWTGFYLGSYVGAGSVDTRWGPATGLLSPHPPGSAAGLGSAAAAVVGVQAGYNYQIGSYVLGVEGDLGSGFLFSRARCLREWVSICTADTDVLATLTGRLGYVFDNVLLYGKAGAAFANTSSTVSGTGFSGQFTGSAFRTGWTAGGGVEIGLTPELSAKAEYAYLDFGTDDVALANGALASAPAVSQSAQMVKLGLNWRPFGGPLPGTGPSLPAPGRDWRGFYLGAHAGGAFGRDEWTSGTGAFAAAAAGGNFPGSGTAMGLLGGGQLGVNAQVGAWVAGLEVSASVADLSSHAKCIAGQSWLSSSYACQNAVSSLGALSGRLGQSWGDLLLYGKAGAAWATAAGAAFPTTDIRHLTSAGTRWGWMVGSGVEYALTRSLSAFLEYDYYDFGTQSLAYSGWGETATARFKQRLDVVRMGVNYRFGTDGAPVAAAVKASDLPAGWSAEVGARYFASSGRMQKDLMDPFRPDRLNSRLIYQNTNGQALETFFRFENQDGLFLKGYAGLGTLAGGDLYDEDFPSEVTYSNTLSALRDGQLAYGALDLGYELVRQGSSQGGGTLGAFVGYRALYQSVNGFGCRQLAADTTCGRQQAAELPALLGSLGLSETETWQGLAVGLNARLNLSERLRLELDAAYLPYATRASADNHWFRSDINPQVESGRGWGTQLEAVLSYAVTDRLDVGIGGRYWYFATDTASTQFPLVEFRSPMTFYAERYGAFLQASYRFGDTPTPAGSAEAVPAEPVDWTGVYVGAALGGGKARSTYASPFPTPVSGDAVDLGGVMAGGQLGADYQLGSFVLGVEASAAWANVVGTNTCFSTAAAGALSGFDCGSRVNALGTVTGRIGYAFDRALVYARGGLAFDRQTDMFNNYNFVSQILRHDSTNTGWTLGGGVEYALLPNLSVGLDYRHVDVGGSSAFTTSAPPSLAGVSLAPGGLSLDLVAMTLNYRFSGLGGAL
ncbi:outer membrane beta-barrel protein [Xanthobacter sp. V4C-4]|uniref:outer membrane protein n=1 Tax=Xanthobacter cornucopiae TaxID=3119924 RepID=UPI003727C020